MTNRRFLALALVLAGLLLVATFSPLGAQTADQRDGRAANTAPLAVAPAPSELTIPTDGVWNFFTWTGGPGVFAAPSFEFTGPAVIDVTDVQRDGDRFEVYDNGNLIGTTSAPTNTGTNLPEQGDPSPSQIECDAGFVAAGWSSGTFNVAGAGAHSITLKNIQIPTNPSSFDSGGGCIRANLVPDPDLVIDSLTHDPSDPTTNDEILFDATVKNVGGQVAGASTLMFKIGGETPGIANTLFEVPALSPGETFTVTRAESNLDAQNYTNTATADYTNAVTEFDEANNTATDNYTVTEVAPPVDIAYSVLTLPVDENDVVTGELFNGDASGNPTGSPLGVGDTVDDPEKLVYVPPGTFEGIITFEYRCTDNTIPAPNTDDATVTIIVSSAGTGVTLTVDFQGAGSGDVTFDVGGSVVGFCSADCTESFGPGNIVKLQARPLALDTFGTWGGACSTGGSSQIVTITLPASGNTICTATFNAAP